MRTCGLSGYRNDGAASQGRALRDILSAPIMINNDRILANLGASAVMAETPRACSPDGPSPLPDTGVTFMSNLAYRLDDAAAAAKPAAAGRYGAERLEGLAATLFRPMGADGVYARTGGPMKRWWTRSPP